jgi:hypothetical protein
MSEVSSSASQFSAYETLMKLSKDFEATEKTTETFQQKVQKDSGNAISFDDSSRTFKLNTEKATSLLKLFWDARKEVAKEKDKSKLADLDAVRKKIEPLIEKAINFIEQAIPKTESQRDKIDTLEIAVAEKKVALRKLDRKRTWTLTKEKKVALSSEKTAAKQFLEANKIELERLIALQKEYLEPRQKIVELNHLKQELQKATPLPRGYVSKVSTIKPHPVGEEKPKASAVAAAVLPVTVTVSPALEVLPVKTINDVQLEKLTQLAQTLETKMEALAKAKAAAPGSALGAKFLEGRKDALEALGKQIADLRTQAGSEGVDKEIAAIKIADIDVSIPEVLQATGKVFEELATDSKKISRQIDGFYESLKNVTEGQLLKDLQAITEGNTKIASGLANLAEEYRKIGTNFQPDASAIKSISSAATAYQQDINKLRSATAVLEEAISKRSKAEAEKSQKSEGLQKPQPSQAATPARLTPTAAALPGNARRQVSSNIAAMQSKMKIDPTRLAQARPKQIKEPETLQPPDDASKETTAIAAKSEVETPEGLKTDIASSPLTHLTKGRPKLVGRVKRNVPQANRFPHPTVQKSTEPTEAQKEAEGQGIEAALTSTPETQDQDTAAKMTPILKPVMTGERRRPQKKVSPPEGPLTPPSMKAAPAVVSTAKTKQQELLAQLASLESALQIKIDEHGGATKPELDTLEHTFYEKRGQALQKLQADIATCKEKIEQGEEQQTKLDELSEINIAKIKVTFDFSAAKTVKESYGKLESLFKKLDENEIYSQSRLLAARKPKLVQEMTKLDAQGYAKQIDATVQAVMSSLSDTGEKFDQITGAYEKAIDELSAKVEELQNDIRVDKHSIELEQYRTELSKARNEAQGKEIAPGIQRPDTLFFQTCGLQLDRRIKSIEAGLKEGKPDPDYLVTLFVATRQIVPALQEKGELYTPIKDVVDFRNKSLQKLAGFERRLKALPEKERSALSSKLTALQAHNTLKPEAVLNEIQTKTIPQLLEGSESWIKEKEYRTILATIKQKLEGRTSAFTQASKAIEEFDTLVSSAKQEVLKTLDSQSKTVASELQQLINNLNLKPVDEDTLREAEKFIAALKAKQEQQKQIQTQLGGELEDISKPKEALEKLQKELTQITSEINEAIQFPDLAFTNLLLETSLMSLITSNLHARLAIPLVSSENFYTLLKKVDEIAETATKRMAGKRLVLKKNIITLETVKEEQKELLLAHFKEHPKDIAKIFKEPSDVPKLVREYIINLIPIQERPTVSSLVKADFEQYDTLFSQFLGIDVHNPENFKDNATTLRFLNAQAREMQTKLASYVKEFDKQYDKLGDFAKSGSLARGVYFRIWSELDKLTKSLSQIESFDTWQENLQKIGALLKEAECLETSQKEKPTATLPRAAEIEQAKRGLIFMELREYAQKAAHILTNLPADLTKHPPTDEFISSLKDFEPLAHPEKIKTVTKKDLKDMKKQIDKMITDFDTTHAEQRRAGLTMRLQKFSPFQKWEKEIRTEGEFNASARATLQGELQRNIEALTE